MRAILLILIIAVVVVIGAIGSGLVDIRATRPAAAPDVDATNNGLIAKGGQAPAFDVETGSVKVGTKDANVKLPTVQVTPAPEEDQAGQSGGQAQPQQQPQPQQQNSNTSTTF